MRHYLLLLFIGFSFCFTSCREDFEFEHSTGSLEFSKDTVYLDTVFTNIGSSTYTLKVYNRSNKDIKIPSIRLGEGDQSKYRLMVDGVPGKVFSDVELLAKDSMFVFIETTIDYSEYANNETTFLYNDQIFFDTGANQQKVELVTLVQDAIFIKPNRSIPDNIKEKLTLSGNASDILGHELNTADELHWTNEKPYVVYGYAMVPNTKTLIVDQGARVHFHADSGLIVDSNGTLQINGALSSTNDLENEVVFEGDRLEPEFADVPGQWGSIYILSANENTINHLTLKNAVVGIFMDVLLSDDVQPKLTIANSQIYNCANFGILTRHAVINGDNLVANNAGQASVALTQGGTAKFRNCTFANYFGSFNQVPVLINDYADVNVEANGQPQVERRISDVNANFDNCILYGSSNFGASLENKFPADAVFKCVFNHCLFKFVDFSNQLKNNPLYPTITNDVNLVLYNECVIAKSSFQDKPDFQDPLHNKLNIGPASVAINRGDTATQLPLDILGFSRAEKPDLGAYVNQEFTEE